MVRLHFKMQQAAAQVYVDYLNITLGDYLYNYLVAHVVSPHCALR